METEPTFCSPKLDVFLFIFLLALTHVVLSVDTVGVIDGPVYLIHIYLTSHMNTHYFPEHR